jgi:hypothetical protein
MKLPNFFIVGAAKSGTTSLYQHLAAHPQVYLSPIKEPDYFCKDRIPQPTDRRRGKAAAWNDYVRLFEEVRDEKAIGEASVTYLCSRRAAQEIYASLPNSRIFVILRNPVERAYSSYLMESWMDSWRRDFGTFREELERDRVPPEPLSWVGPKPYIDLGRYHDQVKRYLDVFGTERVRIYLHEDLKRDVHSLMANVYEFLGVDASFSAESFDIRFNSSARPRFVRFDRMVVEPLAKRLLTRKSRAKLKEGLRKLYYRSSSPPMNPNDRDLLKTILRDDILKLQELIDRDLSGWLR